MINDAYKQNWFNFIDYQPHDGQLRLHNPPQGEFDYHKNPNGARFVVACCGRRWGKSHSAAKEAEIVLTKPDQRVWIVAPNYGTSEKIFRIIWEDMIIKQNMPTKRKSLKEQYIQFEWGSFVQGKSAEHPDSLIGEGLDLVIIDEAAKINRKVWDAYVRPTLSDRKGRAIFISTPEGFGQFWELYLRGTKEKQWYSFNSPSWENQYAFPKGEDDMDLVEAKSNLSKEVFDQEYGAKFTSLAGRVFPFNDTEDVGFFPYNPLLPVYCSIDFGFRMPAALWFQVKEVNGEEHVYIIDEIIHAPRLKSDDFFNKILQKPYKVTRFYGDPASYQVQSGIGMGEAELFYKKTGKRIFALRDKVSRSIISGISHVRSFIETADGKRKLHVNKKCKGISEDLLSYRYAEHKDGTPLKEEPLKDGFHDHGIDALRYFLVSHFPIKQYKYRTVAK
tara:strand:+ start:10994 stop:12331 length:1338 start_codon:yes stop_codon:yes gene_type:complete